MDKAIHEIDWKVFSQVVNETFINLGIEYARQYKKDGKNFITCFQKYPSIRSGCCFIIKAYEPILKEVDKKDFTEYAGKVVKGEWVRVLAEILYVIYAITK